MALAAVAAGADGLLVEVHPNPDEALSDGPQSLTLAQFASLMEEVRHLSAALSKVAEPGVACGPCDRGAGGGDAALSSR
jgi:3-deoxy-7-phosphoheptulonate synthase